MAKRSNKESGLIRSVNIIGTGKMANGLAPSLERSKIKINGICSRNPAKVAQLAALLDGEPVLTVSCEVLPPADCTIIAVADDAIAEVSGQLALNTSLLNSLVVHTSGSVPLSALSNKLKNTGIFYPLQTFKSGMIIDFSKIPICITSGKPGALSALQKLGEGLGSTCYQVQDQQRQQLHLAAVFANNFTNHVLGIASDWMEKYQLDFEMLMPLIQTTVNQLGDKNPAALQTGPAVRGDQKTMKRHLDQ
ncbi:MAG: putative short-subunit dehydrogenase-like oxidoreductase (DUF2520 family), partial [Limisphaerales bacterium]